MDGFRLKCTHYSGAKRKREASPQRKESDFKANTLGHYREIATSTSTNFSSTGNGKKGDRYVSKDVASCHNGFRQYDQYKPDKPIPTGPRNHNQRVPYRLSQSMGLESRIHANSGFKRALSPWEASNTPEDMKLILKSGDRIEKPKNSHGSTSSGRGSQKTFNSVRGLEPQEEYYMKRSIARHKQGYKDPKSTRRERIAENLQREFAKKERYSPIESISTADDERNRELSLNRPPCSKADELEQEKYYRSKQTFDNGGPSILPRPDPSEPIADAEVTPEILTGSNQTTGVMTNEGILGVPIDHTILSAPISQDISLLHGIFDASSVLSPPFPQAPFSQFPKDLTTTHESKSSEQPLLARKDSSTSTSAMSISSGSTPEHSPARNSPHTSLHTVSPSRSSASASSWGKSSTCILCKEPAARPLKALVRCIECRHNYHTHCHTPRITVKNGKLDVDVNSWVCSRCTKIQKVPSTTTTHAKKIVTTVTPNCLFGNGVTPNHKRRKMESEATLQPNNENLLAWDNQVTRNLLSDKLSIELNPMIHANIDHQSGNLSDDIHGNMRDQDGLLPTSAVKDLQHIDGPSLEVPIITPVLTNQDSQAPHFQNGENEQCLMPPEINSSFPIADLGNGPADIGSNNGGKDNDDDAPMDLDSPARSPGPYSPKSDQGRDQQALIPDDSCHTEHIQNPIFLGESKPSIILAENVDYPMLDKEILVFGKETGSDTTSPPYSPRLDSEPLASPVNEILLDLQPGTTEKSTQIISNSMQHEIPGQPRIQNSALLPVPLPLIFPPVPPVPPVPPAVPLQSLLGPTTTFSCAKCSVQWTMFATAARPDGKNYCVQCLYIQQNSPKQADKPFKPRESVTERRMPPPVSKDPRSPPSSIQYKLRLEKDCLNNSFSKVARSPVAYRSPSRHLTEPDPIKQPTYKHPFPNISPIQEPVEKIKTAQQMMEERYQTCPEIFPTNPRPLPCKDVLKLSEERSAVIQTKDKSDGKDIPKRKLTVSEYALRHKEKEKEKERALAKKDSDESPQETENICISEVRETTVTPSIPGIDAGRLVENSDTPVATTAPVAQPDNTETHMSVRTEELRQLNEKMSLEIEQWKKKFEEQQGFVSNYVKHNAKIMGKLSLVEQQKAALEKKTATLETELSTHRTKEEKLREENELLRQERHHQEEEFQTRLRVEREAAEARAKAMDKISRDAVDNSNQEEECQAFLMRNVYKNLTFDIIDPLKDIAGVLTNVPDKPIAVPTTRYSIARKSEPFTFNSKNLRSLHLHREVDRGLDIINVQRNTKSKRSATNTPSSSSATMGETGDGTIMSFEEFARVPPNMVPVLKDGVLAFRAGQLNLRTRRLDRGVHYYKVGRDVPGELRGLR